MTWVYSVTEYMHINKDCSLSCFCRMSLQVFQLHFQSFSISMSTWPFLMLPIRHTPVTSFGVVRIMVLFSLPYSSVYNSSVVL